MLDHTAPDSMHAGDLGPFQDAMGSLFWLHVTNKEFYHNKTVGTERLSFHVKVNQRKEAV